MESNGVWLGAFMFLFPLLLFSLVPSDDLPLDTVAVEEAKPGSGGQEKSGGDAKSAAAAASSNGNGAAAAAAANGNGYAPVADA